MRSCFVEGQLLSLLCHLVCTSAKSSFEHNLRSAPKTLEDAAKSYAMGKTASLFKAELGQSKAASPAAVSNVPNSYEVWQAQQAKLKKELDAKVERQKSAERERDLRSKLSRSESSAARERREREEADKRAKQQAHDK